MDVRAVEEFVARFVVAGSSKINMRFSITTNTCLSGITPGQHEMSLQYNNTTLVVKKNGEYGSRIFYIDVSKIVELEIYTQD